MTPQIKELLVVCLALMFILLPIWGILRVVFPRMERRSKDTIRCRSCWYDLRSTTSDQCPECGAELKETGVWPPGKPNRRRLVDAVSLWLWLCISIAIILSNLYMSHSHYLLRHFEIHQPIVAIENPRSEAYYLALITASGDDWHWFQGSNLETTLPTKTVTIDIISDNPDGQTVTIDPVTLRVVPHPSPEIAEYNRNLRSRNNSEIRYGYPLTAIQLAEFYTSGQDQETYRLLLTEMDDLIQLASDAGQASDLPRTYELNVDFAQSSKANAHLAGTAAENYEAMSDIYIPQPNPPEWGAFVILGLGVIITALGVWHIRRWCYHRDTASWQSEISRNSAI